MTSATVLPYLRLRRSSSGQAVFDLGQPLGRGVDAFGVVAQAGAHVAHGGAGRLQLLRRLSKAAVVAGQFLHIAHGGAERHLGGRAALVKLFEGAHGGGVEFFRVGQNPLFGFQGLVFAGFRWAASISLR